MLRECHYCTKLLEDEYYTISFYHKRRAEEYFFCSLQCIKNYLGINLTPAKDVASKTSETVPVAEDKPTLSFTLPHPSSDTEKMYNWLENNIRTLVKKGKLKKYDVIEKDDGLTFNIYTTETFHENDAKDVNGWFNWVQSKTTKKV